MAKRNRQPGVNQGSGDDARISKKTKLMSLGRVGISPKTKPSTKGTKESITASRKLVIGLDYGTTYTGVAYVMAGNSDARDVKVISDWSGALRKNEELAKVPSCVAYAEENANIDKDCFGYEVEPNMKSYHWTKLLLDEDADHTEHDNPYLRSRMGGILQLPKNKSAADVATDILHYVYGCAMERFDKLFGRELMKATKIECWITVPATWEQAAVDATRNAALNAGFGSRPGDNLNVITEPEAAAIAILSDGIDEATGLYKLNTNVLICDMGGGTIDMQCLTITGIDPLSTDEICEGEGGKSGSTYIDCNLHSWMEEKFEGAYTSLAANRVSTNSKFMASWEIIKKSFDGKDRKKIYRIGLPALGKLLEQAQVRIPAYDIDDHEVLISGAEIMKMFDPVIEKTIGLIESQRALMKKEKQQPFQVIALCGGLGGSEYVWTKIQEYCTETLKNKVQLVTDARAWSCIARGAAIRGLDGNVVLSKRSKRHYGIGVHQSFQEGIDQEEDAFECPIGGKRAGGYIQWCVKKGYRFAPSSRIPTKVYVPVLLDEEDELKYSWPLYSCGSETASNRVGATGIRKEGKIRLDLEKSFKMPKSRDTATEGAIKAEINIVFKLGNSNGILMVEALYQRRVIGTARIDFSKTQASRATQSAGVL